MRGEYKEKLEQLKTRLKRIQDRRKKEANENQNFGITPAVKALIPTIENIERALQFAESNPESVTEGIQMALEQLYTNFAKLGMLRVKASPGTPFDPEVHEAMMRVPSTEFGENEIVEEISGGFSLNKRLIRAAKVAVAIPAVSTEDSPVEEETALAPQSEEETAPEEVPPTEPEETASTEVSSEPAPLDLGDLSLPDFTESSDQEDTTASSESNMPELSDSLPSDNTTPSTDETT